MSLRSSVGVGYGEDSFLAGASACQDAINRLGNKPDAVIVFASSKYAQEEMLKGIRSVSGDALLVGSSTAGEISTAGPTDRNSIVVMVMSAPDIKFYAAVSATPVSKGPHEAGKSVADIIKAQAGDALKSFLMFPDVLNGNGADTVRGVLESLGDHFPVVGGASGDDFQFKKTYQYLNDTVHTDSVVGLGLSGDFKIGIGVKHGWIPVGAPMKVTKSEGGVLHEVDGKPAIKIYEDYFGAEEAAALKTETLAKLAITYPIGLRVEGSDELLIRDPLSVDANGSITCAAELPEGSDIRLMIGSVEEAIKVAKLAAQNALEQLDGKLPQAIIIFNCIGRNKLFGQRSGEEISAIQEVLGREVPLIGFYTYGEQAPMNGEVKNIEKCNSAFHNETVVIAALA
ncbi:MAG: FIST N-terminal domain-containing protein [Patescibacteria group bacterium]